MLSDVLGVCRNRLWLIIWVWLKSLTLGVSAGESGHGKVNPAFGSGINSSTDELPNRHWNQIRNATIHMSWQNKPNSPTAVSTCRA